MGKQKVVEPRPKGRRNARRYGSERETLGVRAEGEGGGEAEGEWVVEGEGWAPSDGHGHDRGGYGRPGRDIELVAREDGQRASIRLLQKRTLSLPPPPHALPPFCAIPCATAAWRPQPVYLAARFHRYRANREKPRAPTETEREG